MDKKEIAVYAMAFGSAIGMIIFEIYVGWLFLVGFIGLLAYDLKQIYWRR